MAMVLVFHILFVGVWLGCVLTETLFERALLPEGENARRILARLHVRVDVFVEIPAFVLAALTGLYMALATPLTLVLALKILTAMVAVLANIYCVKLVFDRRTYAETGDWEAFEQADHRQHKVGAVVLLGILLAIVLGAAV